MCLAKLKSSCVALIALGVLSEGREYCLHAQVYHNDFEPGPSVRMPFVPGPDVDASGLDLEGSFFGGFDLPGAKFHRSNLRGARFSQTSFYRSEKTPVDPASFRGADLRGSVWSQYYRDLQTADFTDARIEGMVPGPLSPSFFLTPQQIRSTMSYKLREIKGTGAYIEEDGIFQGIAAMPRTARVAPGGMVFQVLNRGMGRMQVYCAEKNDDDFRRVVGETPRLAPIRICPSC